MAAITPSTLINGSMGCYKAEIAKFVTTTVNSGDYWASGINDIVTVIPTMVGNGSTASTTAMSISFTASNGTIFMFPATQASTVTLLVLAGSAY